VPASAATAASTGLHRIAEAWRIAGGRAACQTRAVSRALLARDRLRGILVALPSPDVIDVLAHAGRFDAFFLDGQHAALDGPLLGTLIRTVRGHGAAALVRVGGGDHARAELALDLGADGVVFPNVETAAEAERAVASCRLPPQGRRSLGGARLLLRNAVPEDEPLCVVQLETAAGVERADEILAVEGVDAVLPGPIDLAASLGRLAPGRPLGIDAVTADALRRIDEAAARHEVRRARYVAAAAGVDAAFADGCWLVLAGSDVTALVAGVRG
jgi:2-keto-3-deoxy-L-rhamnonate aldolase RhmA